MHSIPESAKRSVAARIVLCAGMRRGGSTLQSQLVAAVLAAGRVQPASSDAVRTLLEAEDGTAGLQVLKCHEFVSGVEGFLASGRLVVVYVYRDIRDVVASICTKYDAPVISFIGGGLRSLLREHEQWTSLDGIYCARYESMVADLPAEIARLSSFLGRPVGQQAAVSMATEFSMERQQSRIDAAFADSGSIRGHGSNAHDRNSLLHRNHIQSGKHGSYRNVLRRHELAALEWICRDWLLEHGYRPETSRAEQALAHRWYRLRSSLHAMRNALTADG